MKERNRGGRSAVKKVHQGLFDRLTIAPESHRIPGRLFIVFAGAAQDAGSVFPGEPWSSSRFASYRARSK